MPHFAERSSPDSRNESAFTSSLTPRESSQARADRIRIKNRRRRYLELHPEYFHGTNLEHAGRFKSVHRVEHETKTHKEEERRRRRKNTEDVKH